MLHTTICYIHTRRLYLLHTYTRTFLHTRNFYIQQRQQQTPLPPTQNKIKVYQRQTGSTEQGGTRSLPPRTLKKQKKTKNIPLAHGCVLRTCIMYIPIAADRSAMFWKRGRDAGSPRQKNSFFLHNYVQVRI